MIVFIDYECSLVFEDGLGVRGLADGRKYRSATAIESMQKNTRRLNVDSASSNPCWICTPQFVSQFFIDLALLASVSSIYQDKDNSSKVVLRFSA
jgi:hypothetical protein